MNSLHRVRQLNQIRPYNIFLHMGLIFVFMVMVGKMEVMRFPLIRLLLMGGFRTEVEREQSLGGWVIVVCEY
jgi:hypothetical protein